MFSRETWMDSLNDNGVQWYKEWSNGREMYEGKWRQESFTTTKKTTDTTSNSVPRQLDPPTWTRERLWSACCRLPCPSRLGDPLGPFQDPSGYPSLRLLFSEATGTAIADWRRSSISNLALQVLLPTSGFGGFSLDLRKNYSVFGKRKLWRDPAALIHIELVSFIFSEMPWPLDATSDSNSI